MSLQATAYLEASHAVANHVLGFDIQCVTIMPDNDHVESVSGNPGLQPHRDEP